MPAERLHPKNNIEKIREFDVAGIDSPTQEYFVGHIGLSEQDHDFTNRTEIAFPLIEMAPPFLRAKKTRQIHCIGTASLTDDQSRRMSLFFDEREKEFQAEDARFPGKQYTIHPHMREPEEDGMIPFPRYSCAGLVIEAYREAGIGLIDTTEENLPSVSLATMKDAYPGYSRRLDRETFREDQGIPGDGPWPVILAGYVMNSMNRTVEEIRDMPYSPKSGDEFFPPKGE